ncbi:MAG: DUF4920 domain-containing protein [Elusimicrobiota bacterium]
MNRYILIPFCVFLALAASCAKADPELKTVAYGEQTDDKGAISVAEFYKRLDELDGRRVKVKGMVTDVCENRGCWINIGEETGPQAVKFKVEDGVIVFPMSAKGKSVIGEGTVFRRKLTLEQTIAGRKHHAEEQGKAFDPKSVTEAETIVMLRGIGARITDSR